MFERTIHVKCRHTGKRLSVKKINLDKCKNMKQLRMVKQNKNSLYRYIYNKLLQNKQTSTYTKTKNITYIHIKTININNKKENGSIQLYHLRRRMRYRCK